MRRIPKSGLVRFQGGRSFPFAQKLAGVDSQANAGVQASAMTAGAVAASTVQNPPAVIWMSSSSMSRLEERQVRLWSDGRFEYRVVYFSDDFSTLACPYLYPVAFCSATNWIEIPPPPSGNGFACRADLDGNRVVDGADLGLILANWGPQKPCNPEPEFPCMTVAGGSGLGR